MPSWLSSSAAALLAASGLVGSTNAMGMNLRQPAAPNYRPRGSDCPSTCIEAGPNPANWTAYGSLDNFKRCNQTLFYHFSLHDMVDDSSVHRIYACSSTGDVKSGARIAGPKAAVDPETITNATFSVGRWGESAGDVIDLASISQHVRTFLNSGYQSSTPGAEVLYAQSGGSTIGLYIGSAIKSFTAVTSALSTLETKLTASSDTSGAVALELCGKGYDSDHIFGFVATSNSSFTPVQQLMQSWSNATCQSFDSDLSFSGPVTFTTPLAISGSNSTLNGTLSGNSTLSGRSAAAHHSLHLRNSHSRSQVTGKLNRRDDCSTVQVVSGDSCSSLATKCGISGDDFSKYNSADNFCAGLTPGQHVCCSSGDLPDFAPQKGSDGSCYAYNVVADDNCASISATYDLTNEKIEGFNENTWGWQGCQNLLLGAVICLSEGSPPMPSELTNAVCGPQKPGTVVGAGGTANLSSLNPCPLNACCDIWGQCGITADFCTDTSTGPPGTAKAGTNGCISNCGVDIVQGDAPSSYINIAYYEGFGLSRDCLYQDISQIDDSFTHVHFSFATLDSSYNVDVGDVYSAFELENLIATTNKHRVLTFGGWAFSTEPATYNIFREGVTAANRDAMASAMANYINDKGLDGVDIDWEYPGAPDIPGIPAGGEDEGANYLEFLKVLKAKLPDKTVSIAAPSSYWYLKAFPIAEISEVVDYIVFMTYDLHGQWDADNTWSQEGCANGNCLRSHINITETMTSLAMVTKAGVNSGKIIVGVTSYGRSFGMADGSCYTPECEYDGSSSDSTATKGLCTDTAGYLADAEIYQIISGESNTVMKRSDPNRIFARDGTTSARVNQHYYDEDSDSQVLVYDNNQWVAYMTSDILASRTAKYKSYNLGGVTNWASDLETFNEAPDPYASWSGILGSVFQEKAVSTVPTVNDHSNDTVTGDWTDKTCSDLAVSNTMSMSGYERWQALDCDDAWRDVVNRYKTYDKPKGTAFWSSMQFRLTLPENMLCDNVEDTSNCGTSLSCSMIDHSPTVGAGAYLVYNAVVQVRNLYVEYHNALVKVSTNLNSQLQGFLDTFAPVTPPSSEAIDLVLTIFAFVGTVAVSAWFNTFLKGSALLAGGPLYDNLKDSAKAAVSLGVSLAGIYIPGQKKDWTAAAQSGFKAYVGNLTASWDEGNSNSLAKIFDGSDESLDVMFGLITNGAMTDGIFPNGTADIHNSGSYKYDIEDEINTAYYATLIPAVWRASGQAAFILDTGLPCGTKSITYMEDDELAVANACIDNRMYALAYPDGNANVCFGDGHCDDNDFRLPTGWASMGSNYGGVTMESIIKASVMTYRSKGSVNSDSSSDIIDPDTASSIMDSIESDDGTPAWESVPGFVHLPVCDPFYAHRVWKKYTDTTLPQYPCYAADLPASCESSSFIDQGSEKSPKTSDCILLARSFEFTSKTWKVNTKNLNQKELAHYGTCAFGVEAAVKDDSKTFQVGSQDMVDIIHDAVAKLARSDGKIGAKGTMDCTGNSGSQNVLWGIYKN